MQEFNHTIHTPEALELQLGAIQEADEIARLVGSLGRAVIHGLYLKDTDFEYSLRQETPLSKNKRARDIDLIPPTEIFPVNTEPFPVDTTCFSHPLVEITNEAGDWFLYSRRHNFAEELHPDVMVPVRGNTVFGIKAVTIPPQTSLAIQRLNGEQRAKDKLADSLLDSVCHGLDKGQTLPASLLKPFEILASLNEGNYYFKLQSYYRRFVPVAIREKASPLVRNLKKAVL